MRGVYSQGKTFRKLKENIRDAFKLMMDDAGTDLPERAMVSEVGVVV